MKKIILTAFILCPLFAMAHGSAIEMVEAATHEALVKFKADEAAAVVGAFNGVKSWVSGDKIKVKAYYESNAKSVGYTCEMMHHGEEEMLMCEKE